MNHRNAERRVEAKKDFEEAVKLAEANGLTFRPLCFSGGDPNDITQYRLTGPKGTWFKDVYPGTRRIYCPDRSKQGPFVGMPREMRWTLLDFVKACIKAQQASERKDEKRPRGDTDGMTGDAHDSRELLVKLVGWIEKTEGTTTQCAFRDLMTDIRHVADHLKVDYHEAEKGSYEVYLEEKEDADFSF